MFHFARAQVLQMSSPVANFRQIFRNVGRQKNMTSIAAVQHPLRDFPLRSLRDCNSFRLRENRDGVAV